ncbi:MAG: hypothetical protein VX822_00375 [Candidatus Neomarinimicrobiota bacterium]|nr:hypothetical protein [Candidatus Neomarinimicrobiota bacterium]
MAPAGTVTVSDVVVAAEAVAFTPPKKTVLLDAVELKLVPVIVTVSPTLPEVGVKEVMVGTSDLNKVRGARSKQK